MRLKCHYEPSASFHNANGSLRHLGCKEVLHANVATATQFQLLHTIRRPRRQPGFAMAKHRKSTDMPVAAAVRHGHLLRKYDRQPTRREDDGTSLDCLEKNGAQKRTRTSTTLRSPAPEAGASTNSAIWAMKLCGRDVRPWPIAVNGLFASARRLSPRPGRHCYIRNGKPPSCLSSSIFISTPPSPENPPTPLAESTR